MCAHQSAIKRGWAAGGRLAETHWGGTRARCRAKTKPEKPANSAHPAITTSSFPIGLKRFTTDSLGREPARAAIASKTPRNAPIHQVAITPHPKANRVGDWVTKTGGRKNVKDSKQKRPRILAWKTPKKKGAAKTKKEIFQKSEPPKAKTT